MDNKIVGVSFVDVHATGSRAATLGPVASLAPGAGKETFVAACHHAEKLGFSTLVRAHPATWREGLLMRSFIPLDDREGVPFP